ncbi:MAG: ATP-binding protein [Myxococcota bacterium]
MSEVSCRAVLPIVQAVRATGRPIEELVEGLPFEVEYLYRPTRRIRWDDYLVLLERSVPILGGAGELEAVIRRLPMKMGVMAAIAGELMSMRRVYELGATWYGPSLFLNTRANSVVLPDGRIRQSVEILPPYRDSELFFHVLHAFLRGAPAVLGVPDVDVQMELHPRRATYFVTLPPKLTFSQRLRTLRSRRSTFRSATDELIVMNQEIRESYELALTARDELDQKSRVLETLNRVGHKLAQHVDVRDLATDVMELFDHQFRFRGVAFFIMPQEGDEPEQISSVGNTSGAPCRSCPLVVGTRPVGRLDLWEDEIGNGVEGDDLLQGLLPWFALALNNVRSFESLSRQTRLLEKEILGRKRAEEQIQRIRKVEALGNLAGSLAHDFNNLLTAVTTYAELAQRRMAPEDPASREVEGILAAARRGAGLIKQILDYSRRGMPTLQRFDVNSMIRGMARLLHRLVGESIELVIVPTEGRAIVMADPMGLEQAIINLAVNSRDAMPQGGRITIEVSNEEDDSPDAPELGYVKLEVSDTGCGMDPETRARIFEPFFTTKRSGEGTGLGLAILQETVSQSGGSVAVQSKPGEGASFTIRLPRAQGGLEATPIEAIAPEPVGGRETILLVEDDAHVRVGTRQVLVESGYRVLEAADATEALRLCESHGEEIDLLLTDVGLPGIDGYELAQRIASLRPGLRGVVYISGYAQAELVDGGLLSKGQVFLPKPFTRSMLMSTIRRLLEE